MIVCRMIRRSEILAAELELRQSSRRCIRNFHNHNGYSLIRRPCIRICFKFFFLLTPFSPFRHSGMVSTFSFGSIIIVALARKGRRYFHAGRDFRHSSTIHSFAISSETRFAGARVPHMFRMEFDLCVRG